MAEAQLDDRTAALEAEADRAAASGDRQRARRLLEQVTAAAPDRGEAWLKLAAMCRAQGDVGGALEAVSGALRVDPLAFLPLLMKASLFEAAGRLDEAGEAYGHALAQLPDEVPPHLKAPVEQARRVHADFVQRVESGLRAAADNLSHKLSPTEVRRIERFSSNIARRTRPYHSDPSHFHYPGLVEREFHDREDFPWLAELEAATGAVTEEFRRLMASERAELVPYIQYSDDLPLRQWKELNWNKAWTAIHLLRNGEESETNARHCPETMALLRRIGQPEIAGRSPNAMFSLLAPGTRIPPHTGVANTRLVCHLPLIVPESCWFRVGAETRNWEAGKAFVFDDTIEHEAANDSDQLRVVFIFDVWHPGLSTAEREAVTALMAGQAQESEPAPVPTAPDTRPPTPAIAAEDLAARRARGVALAKAGDPRAAFDEFRALLELAPNDAEAAANAGLAARRCTAEEEALPLVRAAAEANPNHVRVWQVLGLVERALDDLGPALEAFDRAGALAPPDPTISHSRARTAFEAGRPAVDRFEQALRLAPEDRSVLLGMLAALVAEGRSEEAIARLETELRRDPDWADGHAVLARHRWAMGDRDNFTASIEQALQASPRNPALWKELIIGLLQAECFEKALEAIARGRIAMGPDAIFDANEASCRAELGHVPEADALFEALRPLNDSTVTVRHVRHLLRTRRLEQAEEIASAAMGTSAAAALWPYMAIIWRMTGNPQWEWLEGDPRLVGIYDLAERLPPLEPLADVLRGLHRTVHQPLEQSLRGGTQTDGILFSRIEPEIRTLRKVVVDAVREHIAQLPPADARHPQLGFPRDRPIRFSGSWSVRLTSGGRHVNHIHPRGWFSSALYIALPPAADRGSEPAGWLSLGEPSDELALGLPPIRVIEPKPARLVLFPSTMWHGTKPFARGERLTVAFDVAPPV